MKSTISLFTVLIAAFILSTAAFAQEKAPVKVISSEVVTGVVMVRVQKDTKTLELQCNQGASGCKILPSGNYLMVELPKNYGMYDCRNVEMYRADQDKPEATQRIGEYCMVE
jgi:hypothetical protein